MRLEGGLPHFGLTVGQRGSLPAFGLVGSLCFNSEGVEEALRSVARDLHLYGRGGVNVIERSGNRAHFRYEILQPMSHGGDQVEKAALAIMANVLRDLCGNGWRPIEVWLTHRWPQIRNCNGCCRIKSINWRRFIGKTLPNS